MPTYRAYVLGPDGHFLRAHNFEAVGNDDAVQRAELLVDGHDVELWEGESLVKRLGAKPLGGIKGR